MDFGDEVGLFCLPDELLLAVASFLDDPRDLCALSVASVRLATIGRDARLWQRLRDRHRAQRTDRWRSAVADALAEARTCRKPHWRKSIRRRGWDTVVADVVHTLGRVALDDPWFAQAESVLAGLVQESHPQMTYHMGVRVRASIAPAPRHLHRAANATTRTRSTVSFVGTDIRLQYAAKGPHVTVRCGVFDGDGLLSGPGLYRATDSLISPGLIVAQSRAGSVVGLVGLWSRGRPVPQEDVLALDDCGRVYRGAWGTGGPEGRGTLVDGAARTLAVGTWRAGRLTLS
ncbi:F-box domain containing protein [Pandoravirus salinus]|uniref:F-box domain containing protein n=1 Tax=Pandoravirus salinus TaxID=1349410 RepID=S4W268_9VIRU|nr:F-box domain [Pandoravirus salinus]AGO84532.1 F-box domain containing protein [Pandoravirus salinus]